MKDASGGEGPECARGSPGQWTVYHLDIGEKEEETLETVEPTWRMTRWLQLVVQGISNDEVPYLLTEGGHSTIVSVPSPVHGRLQAISDDEWYLRLI